jgi:hypothetical protein
MVAVEAIVLPDNVFPRRLSETSVVRGMDDRKVEVVAVHATSASPHQGFQDLGDFPMTAKHFQQHKQQP